MKTFKQYLAESHRFSNVFDDKVDEKMIRSILINQFNDGEEWAIEDLYAAVMDKLGTPRYGDFEDKLDPYYIQIVDGIIDDLEDDGEVEWVGNHEAFVVKKIK